MSRQQQQERNKRDSITIAVSKSHYEELRRWGYSCDSIDFALGKLLSAAKQKETK